MNYYLNIALTPRKATADGRLPQIDAQLKIKAKTMETACESAKRFLETFAEELRAWDNEKIRSVSSSKPVRFKLPDDGKIVEVVRMRREDANVIEAFCMSLVEAGAAEIFADGEDGRHYFRPLREPTEKELAEARRCGGNAIPIGSRPDLH
jgi:hypothetical protein